MLSLRNHRNPSSTKFILSRCPWDCLSLADLRVGGGETHLTLTGVHREGGSVVCGHWPPCSVHRSRGLWLLSAWLRLRLWSIPSSECLLWLPWPPSQNLQCYNPLSTDARRQGQRPDQSFSETFLSLFFLLRAFKIAVVMLWPRSYC